MAGWLADAVLVAHLLFVIFVVAGGLLLWRWPGAAWLHLPAALWGVVVEWTGWICPLTPLENRLRRAAGEQDYQGGFVEQYVVPLLYPEALTRDMQWLLGAVVVVVNVAVYAVWWWRWRRGGRARRQH